MHIQCNVAYRLQENEKSGLQSFILTPIYPQAVKTLPLAGRSSGSLLSRRLPDLKSVAVIAANIQPHRLELTAAGTAQVFHLFPF